jgi:hypothetical protein
MGCRKPFFVQIEQLHSATCGRSAVMRNRTRPRSHAFFPRKRSGTLSAMLGLSHRATITARPASKPVRHPVHRRPGQGRQLNSEQMVPGAGLRGGVQAEFGGAGPVRPGQGRDQRLCCSLWSPDRPRSTGPGPCGALSCRIAHPTPT